MKITLESLPVELIADILGELDLESLINSSNLSRRLRHIASDPSLNPWRGPILRNLRMGSYENCFKHLAVRWAIPRQNWVEILSIAHPAFLLFEATIPNLQAVEWEECFNRRFLPGWRKWKKDSWKEAFMKILFRVWHRSHTSCTSDEAWTKYVVLNRKGTANELEISSRNLNPLVLFDQMKLQSNLAHLETRVRLVLKLADVRIIAFGVLHRPRTSLTVNRNARMFLHPPGIDTESMANVDDIHGRQHTAGSVADHGVYPMQGASAYLCQSYQAPPMAYTRLSHPLPALSHIDYPFHTPGGGDKRWLGSSQVEEEGLSWVGGLLIMTQILGPLTHELSGDWQPLQDLDLVVGPGRQQYASFTFADLLAIAPWMEERITKKIIGAGLGN